MLLPALCITLVALLAVYYTRIPPDFPRSMPIIPLTIVIWDAIRGTSRVDFYNKRIRTLIQKHGAVGIWQDGEWTILVVRPAYLVQLLKDPNDTFMKSGSYHRISTSGAAQLFGENIIDSHGDLHDQFQRLLKPAIQRPFTLDGMKIESTRLVRAILQQQESREDGSAVDISALVWRWAVSIYGDYFLDVRLDELEYHTAAIQQIVGRQGRHAIGRMRRIFPFLDLLPWKWPAVEELFKNIHNLETALLGCIDCRLQTAHSPTDDDKVIYRLSQALEQNQISDFHYRSNIKQLFVAGHENVESTVSASLVELAKNQGIQHALHLEIKALPYHYSSHDLDQLPLLTAVVYETLRLYPPLGTLTNRRATKPTWLGPDLCIPAGILVGWHAYGVQTDPLIWGPNAREFDPYRWGCSIRSVNERFRMYQVKGKYIPFSLYSRKCLGVKFAITQIKVGLVELSRRLVWRFPTDHRFSYSKVRSDNCYSIELYHTDELKGSPNLSRKL
ncbi:cytochrome P450-dit2 [Aspergillus udagawae]|uniref:Cytochrome P450-dit2 n=1 Tax=Aspergillus udagawae TaxID=91492 RepID=A0A8E0QHB8_9EURO|nr:cytochrome P450-dit2 [Aspergillus udagawae]GIC84215.1 cytochrome P450-dit2 [Aspergillus udagawae]